MEQGMKRSTNDEHIAILQDILRFNDVGVMPAVRSSRPQFCLWHLLALTTVVCVMCRVSNFALSTGSIRRGDVGGLWVRGVVADQAAIDGRDVDGRNHRRRIGSCDRSADHLAK